MFRTFIVYSARTFVIAAAALLFILAAICFINLRLPDLDRLLNALPVFLRVLTVFSIVVGGVFTFAKWMDGR